jgi:hypothetical protein
MRTRNMSNNMLDSDSTLEYKKGEKSKKRKKRTDSKNTVSDKN